MINKTGIIIILCFLPDIITAQLKISGIVLSLEDKSAITLANVSIYRVRDGSMVTYTFSGDKGEFSIDISNEELTKGIRLDISYVGFQKFSSTFSSIPSGPLTIILKNEPFKLNEIFVKAPKVSTRGDTLDYVASAFTKEQDNNIGEVLQRIPGIVVESSGLVKYNDKPINALYIDGKNMLDSQYGIATKNIRPDLVTIIQIFEKHQPIKVLKEFQFSENAAINLKIAPSARNSIIGIANLGVGLSPPLWDSRLALFKFAGKTQVLSMIKSNNDGNDIASELTVHSIGRDLQFQQPQLNKNTSLNISGETSAPLSNDRGLFNTSHLASFNVLFPIWSSTEATLKISYLNDNQNYINITTTRFIIDGTEKMVLIEKSNLSKGCNVPSFDFTLTANNNNVYIKNKLFGRAYIAQKYGIVTGSGNFRQNLNQDNYDFAEIISIIKPIGNIFLKFNSRTQVSSIPEVLEIKNDSIKQSSELFQFNSENEFSTQIKIGRLRPEISFGFKQFTSRFSSCLTDSRLNPSLSGENNTHYSNTECFINPTINYEIDKFKIQFNIPLKTSFISLEDIYMKKDTSANQIRISPRVRAVINFSQMFEGSISYAFGSVNQYDLLGLTSSNVLTNYRNLTKGYHGIIENYSHSTSIGFVYKDILNLLYIWFSSSYLTKSGGTRSSLTYNEFITIKELIPDINRSNKVIYLSGNISKAFLNNPLILKFQMSFTSSISNINQLENNICIKSRTLLLHPSFTYSLLEKANFEFSNMLNITNLNESMGYKSNYINNRSTLLTYLKLSDKTGFNINIDNYIEGVERKKLTNTIFSDIGFSYQSKKIGVDITLKNIFNKKQYISNTYADLTHIERCYNVRPRSIMVSVSTNF